MFNQVDDDGESYWVFESRDVSRDFACGIHFIYAAAVAHSPSQPGRFQVRLFNDSLWPADL